MKTHGFVVGAVAAMTLLLGLAKVVAADDPFLWLEDRSSERATVWVAEQNTRSDAEFHADPRYQSYVDTAFDLFTSSDKLAYGYVQDGFVYNFWQDDAHNLGLWRRTTVASYKSDNPEWDTVLDFDALAREEGTNWVYSGADCMTGDINRCLISMSPDGGDAVVVREFDLTSRRFVEDGFKSPVSKSDITWYDSDTLMLMPAYRADEQLASGYPRTVKLWKRNTPISDAKMIFEAGPDDLSAYAYVAQDGPYSDLLVGRWLDFYRNETFLIGWDGAVRLLPLPSDATIQQHFDGQLVFSLRSDWRAPDGKTYAAGGLYSFDFQRWVAQDRFDAVETLIAPTERSAVLSSARTRDRLFVSLIDNVRGRVMSFARTDGGWTSTRVALPDNGDIAINHAESYGTSISFSYTDFLTPPSIVWSDDDGVTLHTIQSEEPRFDAAPYVSEQFVAISKDGTKIPYFVVRRKDQAGPAPTLLYGYGGFEESMTPWYSGIRGRLWLEQGNAWVLANIRGGGEFGPAWHQAAVKENRQHAYDDFAAIAEDLVARGVTTAKQLGIVGGSNGGLLTGVLLTQRPELFGAVISEVPLLDMLRYTLLPAGASWIAEYGDPAIPEEAAYIAKYSPYQNVRRETHYPPSLFLTSTADDRVHPGHARKMAALMQSQGHDALFHEETEGGHGGGGDLRRQAAYYASEYLFLQRELEGNEVMQLANPTETSNRDISLDAGSTPALECDLLDAMDKSAAMQVNVTSSQRTRRTELMRLCARIGYSPPASR